jgi:hypothetical protein
VRERALTAYCIGMGDRPGEDIISNPVIFYSSSRFEEEHMNHDSQSFRNAQAHMRDSFVTFSVD